MIDEYAKQIDKERTIIREMDRISRQEDERERMSKVFIKVLTDRIKKTKQKYFIACLNLKLYDEWQRDMSLFEVRKALNIFPNEQPDFPTFL